MTEEAAAKIVADEERRPSIERMANPKTVAVVGVSDKSMFADTVVRSLRGETEFIFVHPAVESAFGQRTYPSLREVGRPVDVVFSAVAAEQTLDVVEQAVELGAGGLVTVAGGFAELGEVGDRLQRRMRELARAGNLPIVGPNGIGMINVPRKLDLTILPDFKRRVGGLSVASQSGAMIEAMAASSWRAGGAGLNILFSAGNEAVTDLADYLDFFVTDPGTRVIALILEKIRRPAAFFNAAQRCLEAGKPIVAIKLGRSERSQRLATSHTGTLTGDAWVYDVAFKQAGILLAEDVDDLVDRVQFFEQLPRRRWTPLRGLAVITGTGGVAQLASDLAEAEPFDLPEVERLKPFVAENIPGCIIPNPLDVTGFIIRVPGLWEKIVTEYASAPEFDAVLWTSQHADWDVQPYVSMADSFCEVAKNFDKAIVIAPLAGNGGQWLDKYREDGIGVGNGLRGCMRGFAAMTQFMRTRTTARVASATEISPITQPSCDFVDVPEGRMLPFAATMELLQSAGIVVADYHLVRPGQSVTAPRFPGPYVVKLADVAHRTEHDAVRVRVDAGMLGATVNELRAIAAADALPELIAIQPMIKGHGEVFLGLQAATELGPVVAFGLGGVLVEVLKRVGGRMAPMTAEDARELLAEFDDTGFLDGFRGAASWNRATLVETLVAAGNLAAGGRDWIDSFDVNPMIVTDQGPVAVDGLCFIRA